ncbi:MAG TPA: flagellar export chaperone FlgN [Anaerovoracaceae bacterium]|nr:flagellar export chaperone FlgN [Anaerovoracaceae bacterium]
MDKPLDKNFKKSLDGLYGYLMEIVELYEKILPVVKSEFDAINADDIYSLNESLKVQQALLHKTKNFDKTISSYTAELDIDADNLTALIIQLPEEQQFRFYSVLGRFTAAIQEISFYKEKCRSMLQTKLHNIDRSLAEQKGIVENETYEKDASKAQQWPSKSFETIV